jgi:signal transduction histidine kinase
MLRLRLVFAALALALAVPGALLVSRALESVALERAARERAVAERVFDVMEQALSAQLAVEEARPASDYEFTSPVSPLRAKPADAFAIGWFQIEADGSVSAPAWSPRAAALAAELARDGVRLEAARQDRGRARERRAQPTRAAEAAARAPAAAPAQHTATPGVVGDAAAAAPETANSAPVGDASLAPDAPTQPGPQPSSDPETDAYQALAKLNIGAKEREERKQRVYVEEQQLAVSDASEAPVETSARDDARVNTPQASESRQRARSQELVARALAAEPGSAELSEPAAESGADARRASAAQGGLAAADETAPSVVPPDPQRAASPEAKPEARQDAAGARDREKSAAPTPPPGPNSPVPGEPSPPPQAARSAEAPTTQPVGLLSGDSREQAALVRVVVDPMRGRLARSGELLLVRSAWIGSRGVRQGVVYDVAALERVLGTQALASTLADGKIALRPALGQADRIAAEGSLLWFEHRFAEPFHAFEAQLAFASLGDEGAHSVYWLAVLFALAGAAGLYAAYRTTAVALHFAERRSNFAAAVSHELKTPLTAIRLYAEMLRDGLVAGEEKRREYYGSITAETERLSRLINNVLELSRLERGARSLELSVGEVLPVVREAVELLRPHAAAHGLALELTAEEPLPAVRFERDALLQIVFNLVDNAVKYGRGEPARIEVACQRAGDGVAIRVRDHGPGVPRPELTRILEPFYRRGDELTRRAPGAGIGLALVRALVREMGAALAVGNADGGGFEASVTLARAASS